MNRIFRKYLAAIALTTALLCTTGTVLAESPPECDPNGQSIWSYVVIGLGGFFGLPPDDDRIRAMLGDECGDGFW